MNTPTLSPQKTTGFAAHSGLYAGLAAFTAWGVLPVYWKMLSDVPAVEVLCHRAAWGLLFLLPYAFFTGRMGDVTRAFLNRRTLGWLSASATILAVNWLIFIWAVQHGHVMETSLGYYINPLLNVCAGVFFFREQPRRAQWIAISLAVFGVLGQIVLLGTVPWIALSLGITFTIYGILRKLAPVESLPGLCVETCIMMPVSLGFIIYVYIAGTTSFSFAPDKQVQTWFLMGSGLATSIPLLFFAYCARRTSLITLGLMQYIGPSLSFLLSVFCFHETFTPAHALSFTCIWCALLIYSIDGVRAHKRKL